MTRLCVQFGEMSLVSHPEEWAQCANVGAEDKVSWRLLRTASKPPPDHVFHKSERSGFGSYVLPLLRALISPGLGG